MCFRPAAVSTDKTCPSCKATCQPTETVCPQCGAELPASTLPIPNVGTPGAPGAPDTSMAPGIPQAPKAPGSK